MGNPMKLAYHTNTWGGVVGHPAGVTSVKESYYLANGSTEEALHDIAGAGYHGFELFDGNLMQYAEREHVLRDLMEQLQLELVGVYSGANFIYPEILGDELGKIQGVIELAARLGATHLVLGGGAVRATGTEDRDYQLLAEGLDRVSTLAGRAGLIASFHPHLGTCAQSPEQIARVLDQTSIGFCPDTAHLEAGGGDPVDLIRTYADRIPYVHFKDYADGDFLPLGQGRQNFSRMIDQLRSSGYDGWITVELDAYPGHPAEAARISKTYLDGMLAGRDG